MIIIFLYRHQDERKELLVSVSDGAESILGSTSSCPSVCVCVHIHSNDHDWSRSHSYSSMFSFKYFPWPSPIATASSCHKSVCKVLWMSCASLRLAYAMFYFFQSYVGLMSLKYWYDWNDWISVGINQGLSQFYTSEIGVEGMLSLKRESYQKWDFIYVHIL
mgnify:CR=1 FL=1